MLAAEFAVMNRRLFFVVLWSVLAATFAGIALIPLFDNGSVSYVFFVISGLYGGIAGYCRFHPEPVVDPDDPAPRRWFEFVGVVVVALLIAIGVVVVAIGP